MARQRFNFKTGEWEDADKAPTEDQKIHHVITDSIDATWHPCDGKMYESKSQFRRTTKANGCIEYGNEDPRKHIKRDRNPKDVKESVIRAYEQAQSGNARPAMSKSDFERFE